MACWPTMSMETLEAPWAMEERGRGEEEGSRKERKKENDELVDTLIEVVKGSRDAYSWNSFTGCTNLPRGICNILTTCSCGTARSAHWYATGRYCVPTSGKKIHNTESALA